MGTTSHSADSSHGFCLYPCSSSLQTLPGSFYCYFLEEDVEAQRIEIREQVGGTLELVVKLDP